MDGQLETALESFDGDVTPSQLQRWLSQFEIEDLPIILPLLRNFRYFSLTRFRANLKRLCNRIAERTQTLGSATLYVPVGYAGKSGGLISYLYRVENQIPSDRFIGMSELKEIGSNRTPSVVFLDDFIGSGEQAIETWKAIRPLLADRVRLYYGVATGFRRGIGRVQQSTDMDVICADPLTEADLPLSNLSPVYPSVQARAKARDVLKIYGQRIDPDYPLGFKDTQCLLAFFYSTPNNTFPIFWGSSEAWEPLLPRVDRIEAVEPLRRAGKKASPSSPTPRPPPRAPPAGGNAPADKPYVNADLAAQIIQEFRSVDALLALSPALVGLGISNSCGSSWLGILRSLKGAKHEGRDVVASILLTRADVRPTGLDPRYIEPSNHLSIDDTQGTVGFTQLVDGLSGCTVVHADGSVVGNALFSTSTSPDQALIPTTLKPNARATLSGVSLMLTSHGAGRLSVFYRGERIMTYRGVGWRVALEGVSDAIQALASRHGIPEPVLTEIVATCVDAGDAGNGALVTVGFEDKVLARASLLASVPFSLRSVAFGRTKRAAILSLITQDGATVATSQGKILAAAVRLSTLPTDKGEPPPGKGTRHATAAHVSSGTGALAIVTSSDGPVRIFSGGKFELELLS